jgi:PIN domain nuclease of toxin-antitoxin system
VAILLDTHVLLEMMVSGKAAEGGWGQELIHVSVASLWEIAIKVRLAKLETAVAVSRLEEWLSAAGWMGIPITIAHVTAEVSPWPDTNDPFDRLLLAVCQVEGLELVTRDRRLVGHPLAWGPASA